MNSFLTRGQLQSRQQLRDSFIHDLFSITGDTRIMFAPKPTDGLTTVDEALQGRTFTHDATIAGRLGALGLGYYTTFDGASNFAATPDAAELSFTTGALSIVALANVTDSAAARSLVSKTTNTQLEWEFRISTADGLSFLVSNLAGTQTANRDSNAAITQAAWGLFGMTFTQVSAAASAMNDVTLYENGVVKASTATNNASYPGMSDGTSTVEIGSAAAHLARFFVGSIALVIVCAKILTASDHWALKKLVNSYYGLSL